MRGLFQDVRHACRAFIKSPGFTAIAVISIAFGTGANVATFSVADTLLLKPMPVLRPSELLTVGGLEQHGTIQRNMTSYRNDLDQREPQPTFEGLVELDYVPVVV